jgi:hypothetical protein
MVEPAVKGITRDEYAYAAHMLQRETATAWSVSRRVDYFQDARVRLYPLAVR